MKKDEIRLGCLIMASGQGRRFGGNKLTALFCGRPMIERILLATEGLFDRRIAVTRHADVAQICREIQVDVLLHDLPGRNDTIRLGLDGMDEGIGGCMFCPGDMPLLRRESLAALRDAFLQEPECIWRLGNGAPVIFPAWAFPELRQLPEGTGGGFVLRAHPDSVRSIAPGNPDELLDADTPEMLRNLEGLFGKGDSI